MKSAIAPLQYLKYLALVGLGLLTAGLVSGLATGWTPLPLALMVGGAGLILVGLAFSDIGRGRFWQQRATEAGTNAIIATIAVLVIIGLLNFLAVQHSQRLDLTENQIFTLAPQSQQVLEELDKPVKVVIFATNRSSQDRQLLESFQRQGSNFEYEYVDPYANPRLAQEFGATQPGMAFLEVEDERRFLQNLSPQEPLSERSLTNALDQIRRDRTISVYFTTGHREFAIEGPDAQFTQAAAALEEQNYSVTPLNLTETESVPNDADVVIVAGPAEEFFEAEVAALETFLNDNGGLMLLIDPRTSPRLGTLLDDWGISLDDRIVLDTSGAGQLVGLGPAAPIVTDYGDHPITRDFQNGRSFYPLARPVNFQEVPGINATALLQTNSQSRAETLSEEGELQFDPEAAPEGPYTLGVAMSRPDETAETEADPPEDRLVVIGNATFASNGLFEQQLNGDVFLNAVSWLGQQDDATLSIRPKEVTNRRITLTVQQQIGLGLFSLLILPLVGFAMAVVMWLRRR